MIPEMVGLWLNWTQEPAESPKCFQGLYEVTVASLESEPRPPQNLGWVLGCPQIPVSCEWAGGRWHLLDPELGRVKWRSAEQWRSRAEWVKLSSDVSMRPQLLSTDTATLIISVNQIQAAQVPSCSLGLTNSLYMFKDLPRLQKPNYQHSDLPLQFSSLKPFQLSSVKSFTATTSMLSGEGDCSPVAGSPAWLPQGQVSGALWTSMMSPPVSIRSKIALGTWLGALF